MKLKTFLMVVLGCLICSLSFNIFLSPYSIMPGGVSGIAIIFKKIFDLEESLSILILSIGLLGLSLITLGKRTFFNSVVGSILFPLFVYITTFILQYLDLSITNRLLASIIGGLTFGFGIGIVYKEGFTTGGSEIIAKTINKYFPISLGNATLIIDGIITIFGGFIFGFETLIYSLITIYMMSIMIDKVMLGPTIVKGKGAYTEEDKYIILVVIPTSDYYKMKDGLKKLDKNAFFVVSDSYEVGGGK